MTGVADATVREVEVRALGERQTQTPSKRGGFIAVFAGAVEKSNLPTVTATFDDGRRETFELHE